MKPREFDDLVKRKFDEGGFEYKAQNWDRLAEELDGRGKKRALLVWWMPLVGIAASVALAMGVPLVLKEGGEMNKHSKAIYASAAIAAETPEVATVNNAANATLTTNTAIISEPRIRSANQHVPGYNNDDHTGALSHEDNEERPLHFAAKNLGYSSKINFNLNTPVETFAIQRDSKKIKKQLSAPGYYTFKETTPTPGMAKIAISVSGGLNYGSQSNGFIFGATARRMINDKVFVEGDIAFIGTNNSSKYSEVVYSGVNGSANDLAANSRMSPATAGANNMSSGSSTAASLPAGTAARGILTGKSTNDAVVPAAPVYTSHVVTTEKAYNLYYAQLTPTIGYKLMKRMSVGIGPDFQQMLGDNRPVVSPTETGNIQEVPMFDIGFMGKTEYAISKNVKAAVFYREGINNIITPMNRFIDRNYVQFQVKCAILNR